MTFFPELLRALPVWVLWKLEERNGRTTKVPYSANYAGRASSTNPRTWSTFEKASEKLEASPGEYCGLGVVVAKEYRIVFIDVDHCLVDGVFDARAEDILEAFPDTYIELSQSGSGLHILALGEIPRSFKNSTNGVEMYSEKRFCAMTGNAIVPAEVSECPSALAYTFNRYKTPDKTKNTHELACVPLMHDDKYIVDKAMRHGGKFPLLFSGEWKSVYESHSEADAGLCAILAFWTDANPDAIDRIFRSSGLYREKWEREDYRTRTIETACSHVTETLSEFIERRRREEGDEIERILLSQW